MVTAMSRASGGHSVPDPRRTQGHPPAVRQMHPGQGRFLSTSASRANNCAATLYALAGSVLFPAPEGRAREDTAASRGSARVPRGRATTTAPPDRAGVHRATGRRRRCSPHNGGVPSLPVPRSRLPGCRSEADVQPPDTAENRSGRATYLVAPDRTIVRTLARLCECLARTVPGRRSLPPASRAVCRSSASVEH